MHKELGPLWHFTRILNLNSILNESRLLSHAEALKKGLRPAFVSDSFSRAEDLANGRAGYVFLSLAPFSPFFKKTASYSTHVWFRISPEILNLPGVKIKSGASQSKHSCLQDVSIERLRRSMWFISLETRIRYRADGGPDNRLIEMYSSLDSVTRDSLSTEVLVPGHVDLINYADGIYAVSFNKVTVLFHPIDFGSRPRVPAGGGLAL